MIRALIAAVVMVVSFAAVPAAAASPTYGEYSLMFGKNAGQVWSGGSAASQWAWKQLAADESEIAWDCRRRGRRTMASISSRTATGFW